MANKDNLLDSVLANLILDIPKQGQEEKPQEKPKPSFGSIRSMFDSPFVQDTLNVISQEMFGVVPKWIPVGSPFTIHNPIGGVKRLNPTQIEIQEGLLNAVSLDILKGFSNPVDWARNIATHELTHVGQAVGDNPVSRGENSLGKEFQAHVFSSLIRSLSDLASAKPEQVEVGNVMNRAESFLLRSLQNDSRFKDLKELPTEKIRAPMVSLLKDLIALDFFSGHPVNQESKTR